MIAAAQIFFETIISLRRDRFFAPSFLMVGLLLFVITLISEFTIEEMPKILFDLGLFVINITGSFVAIVWGAKLLNESTLDGFFDIQLTAPLNRTTWLLGKFAGIATSLTIMGVVLGSMLFSVMAFYRYLQIDMRHLLVIACYVVGWLCLAALAILLSTFSSYALTLFSTFALWAIGLTTEAIQLTITAQTNSFSKSIIHGLAIVWNFQNFNLSEWLAMTYVDEDLMVGYRYIYGFFLCSSLLCLASIIFNKKDILN